MNNSPYEAYYHEYLGLVNPENSSSSLVLASSYRDLPINQKCYYPIIITQIGESNVCSCGHTFYTQCKSSFDGTLESLQDFSFPWKKMRRYSASTSTGFRESKAITLNKHLLRTLDFNINNNIEDYILSKQSILNEERQFACVEDCRIVSTAFISDIYCTGCNIVVYTDPNYRSKGYGREVVKACINWCLTHRLVPVYLVEESNIGSIALAESLGLDLMNTEWVITDIERNSI